MALYKRQDEQHDPDEEMAGACPICKLAVEAKRSGAVAVRSVWSPDLVPATECPSCKGRVYLSPKPAAKPSPVQVADMTGLDLVRDAGALLAKEEIVGEPSPANFTSTPGASEVLRRNSGVIRKMLVAAALGEDADFTGDELKELAELEAKDMPELTEPPEEG